MKSESEREKIRKESEQKKNKEDISKSNLRTKSFADSVAIISIFKIKFEWMDFNSSNKIK